MLQKANARRLLPTCSVDAARSVEILIVYAADSTQQIASTPSVRRGLSAVPVFLQNATHETMLAFSELMSEDLQATGRFRHPPLAFRSRLFLTLRIPFCKLHLRSQVAQPISKVVV